MNSNECIATLPGLTPISEQEYRLLTRLIYDRFGISLGEQKRSLVVGRLQKVLRKQGFTTFREYYDYVIGDRTGDALSTLITRISTNHTFFYREKDHFEYFSSSVLPHLADASKKRNRKFLRIWCPGCSSGEEPYTLAMLIAEFFGNQLSQWDVGVLATDISVRALEKARAGTYAHENVAHLPPALRNKYLRRKTDDDWTVKEQLREMVLFRRLNLMRETYPFKGKFQVIFCRNVMIYFDAATRAALVARFHRYTEEGGYLFIGHAETLGRGNPNYRYVKPAVYQKDAILEAAR